VCSSSVPWDCRFGGAEGGADESSRHSTWRAYVTLNSTCDPGTSSSLPELARAGPSRPAPALTAGWCSGRPRPRRRSRRAPDG
jgi:hypothetical protein